MAFIITPNALPCANALEEDRQSLTSLDECSFPDGGESYHRERLFKINATVTNIQFL
jgi:hypothetical protein